jgi:sterol desaturase/sphingolipid hydroxylase (fatty acid hydroxylase superfamily)
MPSILDILRDPATLAVFALFAALAAWERITPGRALPQVRGWNVRALLAFVLFLAVSIYLPLLLADWIAPLQLFDLSSWPTAAAAALGVLVYEFGAYAYHRSLHTFTPLWRAVHQMHHSAERLDVPGAFWFGPLDMIGWSLLPALALTLLGLAAPAATAAALFITFLGIFQHANLRTPRWLGYLVQRPESHTIHHARGIHAKNYADVPFIDMLFGTFENPRRFEHATGFWDGASARVLDMLLARDVSRPAASLPVRAPR